jgi:hypothetical protein
MGGAEQEILSLATKLGEKYSPSIPLVEAAEERIKLAKLSIAVAARLFSTDTTGENIIVRICHVQYAFKFLEYVFTKPSLGYDIFSLAYKSSVSLSDIDRRRLDEEFKQFPEWWQLREILLDSQIFRQGELIEQMGYDVEEKRRLFKWFGMNRLIKTTPVGYVKQPLFTDFLKNMNMSDQKPKLSKKDFKIK